MKAYGRIVRWNPEVGYGFARPEQGNYEVLIHSKDVRCGQRGPALGDEVRYRLSMDKYQRPWGREVEIAVEGEFPPQRSPLPYIVCLSGALLMLGIILA